MRGTFTHHNPDFLEDIKTMLNLGFTELSMEPVVTAKGDPSGLTEEDLPILMQQYEDLAKLQLERYREGRPFTFYHYMIDLTGGPCIYKRISGCGSCAANAYHATGSVKGVYEYGCKLFRKRMECAIMVQVAEKLGDQA